MPKVSIEVCCDSVSSALVAQECKVDRIELCSSIDEGGITPSIGLFQTISKHYLSSSSDQPQPQPKIHVLIRPRPGDFTYNSHELEVIRQDILQFISSGCCCGIVLGFLHANATINESLTRHFRDLCYSLDIDTTFHRAFDVVNDQFSALNTLIDCKIPRLLTSGGYDTAFQGIERIADLVTQSEGKISIMPGGGITEMNAKDIIECTGVQEIHGTFRRAIPSSLQYIRNNHNNIGTAHHNIVAVHGDGGSRRPIVHSLLHDNSNHGGGGSGNDSSGGVMLSSLSTTISNNNKSSFMAEVLKPSYIADETTLKSLVDMISSDIDIPD